MIPLLSVLIAVYTIARLVQVPLEHCGHPRRWVFLLLVSVGAIFAIVILTVLILGSTPSLPSVTQP